MKREAIRPGGLFRCCVQSLLDAASPAKDGEIRGCTVGKGCDARVIYRFGAWEWLPQRQVGKHR